MGVVPRTRTHPLPHAPPTHPPQAPGTARRALAQTDARPVRILLEYQLPADMAPATAKLIREVVDGAVLTLQGYIQVGCPVGLCLPVCLSNRLTLSLHDLPALSTCINRTGPHPHQQSSLHAMPSWVSSGATFALSAI
jgi:hypothetical protein